MGLDYTNGKFEKQKARLLSENEKTFSLSKDFPNCKGLYPDCPETPSLDERMCRTCPKTDRLEKPRIEQD